MPLGLTWNRTFVLDNGHGIDLGIGYYNMVERPEGAADSQLKLLFTWIPG